MKKIKFENSRITIVADLIESDAVDTAHVINMLLEKAEWPKRNDRFWAIEGWGEVIETMWLGCEWDKDNKAFGNCFRTKKEAIKARDKIREVLND